MNYEAYAPTLRRLAWAGVLVGGLGLVGFGQHIKDVNRAYQQQEAERLQPFKVASEMVPLSFKHAALQLTPLRAYGLSKRENLTTSWRYLTVDNYVLVNPTSAGKSLCPAVLSDLIDANGDKSLGWPVSSMDSFLRLVKGKDGEPVRVFIPRFNEAPAGFDACQAFGFDAERKMLTYDGKPVVIWANDQRSSAAIKSRSLEPAPVLVY